MKILLRRDTEGVGRRGDIVEVADGFARNHLIPAGQGMVATKGIEAQATAMRRARDLREASDRKAAVSKATVLAGAVLTVAARTGSTGRLFGSVGAAEIVEAVHAQKGVEIDRRTVALDEPIKATGSYDLPVRLFQDIETTITVEVVAAD